MSYRLRMSAELSDWLAGLCASQPGSPEAVTAAETGAALTAVLDAADPAQLALVTDLGLAGPADSGDPLAAVDDAAQSVRSGLEVLRAQVASAAEEDASRERELRDRLRSGEIAAETLRIRAAAAAGRYTASAASRDIQLAIITVPGQRSGETAAAKAGLADAQDELTAAGTELAAIVASARALRRSLLRGAGGTRDPGTGDPDEAAAGLLELQADPFGTEIRILLAIEPADTVTLLAVLEGQESVIQYRPRAIQLAGELLDELRDNGWRAGDAASPAVAFADVASFLERFFPGSEDAVHRRSAVLAAASTLTGLRRRRGLSLADVADRTGMTARELWRLETDGLRSAALDDVAVYLRGLGCRLEITALVGGSGPVIL